MASVRIMVTYDGEWVKSAETGLFRFDGSKAKGMLVPKNITHKELSNRVYSLLDINRDEYAISMKFLYASSVPTVAPAEIVTNDDVNFFVCENSGDVSLRTPLCVTLVRRDPNDVDQQQVVAGEDASSSQTFNDVAKLTDNDADGVVEWATTREALTTSSTATHSEEEEELGVRQLFSSKKELQERLSLLAIRKKFEFRVHKSSPDVLVIGCVDDKCQWRLRACRFRDNTSFQIRKFENEHSCSTESRHSEHRQASSWVISQLIKSKCLGTTTSQDYKPKDIIEDVRRELGVKLSYEKAWRAREIALSSEEGVPRQRRLSGWSKRERSSLSSGNEERRIRSCKRCGEVGHYSKTCSIPITTLALQGTTTIVQEEGRVIEEFKVIQEEEKTVEEDEVMEEDKVGES